MVWSKTTTQFDSHLEDVLPACRDRDEASADVVRPAVSKVSVEPCIHGQAFESAATAAGLWVL